MSDSVTEAMIEQGMVGFYEAVTSSSLPIGQIPTRTLVAAILENALATPSEFYTHDGVPVSPNPPTFEESLSPVPVPTDEEQWNAEHARWCERKSFCSAHRPGIWLPLLAQAFNEGWAAAREIVDFEGHRVWQHTVLDVDVVSPYMNAPSARQEDEA